MTTRPISGTPKADVYSFAIILQEITYRAMPYFYDTLDLKCNYFIIVFSAVLAGSILRNENVGVY